MFRASTAGRHLSLESGHGNQDSHELVVLGSDGAALISGTRLAQAGRSLIHPSGCLCVGGGAAGGEIRSCHSNWCSEGWAGLSIYNTAGHDGVRQ